METWIPAIEVVVFALLFLLSANISASRLMPQPLGKNLTQSQILRESNLSGVSLATTLIYLGLLAYLLANFAA